MIGMSSKSGVDSAGPTVGRGVGVASRGDVMATLCSWAASSRCSAVETTWPPRHAVWYALASLVLCCYVAMLYFGVSIGPHGREDSPNMFQPHGAAHTMAAYSGTACFTEVCCGADLGAAVWQLVWLQHGMRRECFFGSATLRLCVTNRQRRAPQVLGILRYFKWTVTTPGPAQRSRKVSAFSCCALARARIWQLTLVLLVGVSLPTRTVACTAGYQFASGSVACECSPGWTSTSTTSLSCTGTAATCASCPAGSLCEGGSSQPVACSCTPGYASTSTSSTACAGATASCKTCVAGFYCTGNAVASVACSCKLAQLHIM
jgi:hypothetical protein